MCRVVEIWNCLDVNAVNALIINQFIRKIKCCNLVKFIRGRTLKYLNFVCPACAICNAKNKLID